MTKEQQIEEMANALKVHGRGRIFGNQVIAKGLVEDGYGNLREFTKKLKTNIENMYADNPYSSIDYNEGLDDALKCIDELLKEYDNVD